MHRIGLWTATGVWLLVGAGCGTLPTGDIGEESVLVFRDFDADPDALAGAIDRIDVLMDGLELEGKQRFRSFQLPRLESDDWDGLTLPTGIEAEQQLRFGTAALSRHSLEENLRAQVQEEQVCINADAVKCHRRIGQTDVDCFLDGSCDVYRTRNDIRIETVISKWWLTNLPVDYRRVELSDGRKALVARTWLEEKTLSDREKSEWTQRFGVDVFIEDPEDAGRTRRWYANWLAGDVAGMGNNWTSRVLYRGVDDGFENPDSWLDGDECKIDTSDCEWP